MGWESWFSSFPDADKEEKTYWKPPPKDPQHAHVLDNLRWTENWKEVMPKLTKSNAKLARGLAEMNPWTLIDWLLDTPAAKASKRSHFTSKPKKMPYKRTYRKKSYSKPRSYARKRTYGRKKTMYKRKSSYRKPNVPALIQKALLAKLT